MANAKDIADAAHFVESSFEYLDDQAKADKIQSEMVSAYAKGVADQVHEKAMIQCDPSNGIADATFISGVKPSDIKHVRDKLYEKGPSVTERYLLKAIDELWGGIVSRAIEFAEDREQVIAQDMLTKSMKVLKKKPTLLDKLKRRLEI